MDNHKAEVKSGIWSLHTFLKRAECVFDYAILREPTGDERNKFCDLNIERMSLIQNTKDIENYARELHGLLDLLSMNEGVLDEMSCDDTRFGDAIDNRNQLVTKLVAIMKK